jgi:hypothetical protein
MVANCEYRVFVIGPDGHVRDRYELSCADEVEARERAEQLVDGHDVELWQRDRKIETYRPNVKK